MSIQSWISFAVVLFTLASSARAQSEPNDTCATASVLTTGTYTNLVSTDQYDSTGCCPWTDFDYYRITIPPGDRLQFTCTRTGSSGQPATLWTTMRDATSGCPGFYSGQAFNDSGTLNVANLTTTPKVKVVDVYAWLVNEGYANIYYDLGVVLAPDACPNAVDDRYEPAGLSPTPIGFGTMPNLFARFFNDDLYSLQLPQGTTIRVRIDLNHAQGDLDLTVYDSSTSLSSISLTNQEHVMFAHTLSFGDPVYVRVAPKPNAVTVCNNYSLTIDVVAPALGTNYCQAGVNSYGVEARILPDGSSSVSANHLWFHCQAIAAGSPCMLVAGTQQQQLPFGDGWLCVGGSLLRLKVSIPNGSTAVMIPDFTTAPGNVITPGTTWNYQMYYRDLTTPPGAGFNLTDAVSITMTP